ncbi:MAG: aminotransferase class V-fold PLP-dependent enzyme [Waterburya sp.]
MQFIDRGKTYYNNVDRHESFQPHEVVGASRQVPLIDGRSVPQVFLDNAASTKPFQSVNDFISDIMPYYSNIHRGTGFDSIFCTQRYEEARQIIGNFVGWDSNKDVVIPVRNTTEGMNLLAQTIMFKPRGRVITTLAEHHSADLPWRDQAEVDYIPVNSNGELILAELERLLIEARGTVQVVSVTGASNVTGIVNPIYEIATLAHRYGALIVVDGAQLIPHRQFHMRPHDHLEHIDFVVFSGHKMNCPYGIGVVVGRRDIFDAAPPYQPGGGTVQSVGLDRVIWAESPEKQEAGTPNILGMFALAKTIEIMKNITMEAIEEQETRLTILLLQGLTEIPNVDILGLSDPAVVENRVGIVTFQIKGLHHGMVGAILSHEWGIAIRNGCFCAHPLVKQLLNVTSKQEQLFEAEILQGQRVNVPGAVRCSLGIHNTETDVKRFVEAVSHIARRQWQGEYVQDVSSGEFLPSQSEFDFSVLPDFSTKFPIQARKRSSHKKHKKSKRVFGEIIPNLTIHGEPVNYPVLNERAVRAGAGIMLVLAAFAGNAALSKNYLYLQMVAILFPIEFAIRVFGNLKYAPIFRLATWCVRKQIPEYTGAIQKKFAWTIGLVMGVSAFFIINVFAIRGSLPFTLCMTCLVLLWFEASLGICLGCNIYYMFAKFGWIKNNIQPACPGGNCPIDK